MSSFNRVILVGNLTRNVELKTLNSGTVIGNLGLAINDRRKNAQGEFEEVTTFVEVTAFNRDAEVAAEFLAKGSPVLIEGKLRQDTWQGQDGQNRSKMIVICDRVCLLPRQSGGNGEMHESDDSESHQATKFEEAGLAF